MCIYSMGLAGATAPVTVAGAVMQANAEILSALVLFQLARPGLPCIYVADPVCWTSACTLPPRPSRPSSRHLFCLYNIPVMATGLTGNTNGPRVSPFWQGPPPSFYQPDLQHPHAQQPSDTPQ